MTEIKAATNKHLLSVAASWHGGKKRGNLKGSAT